VAPSINAEEKAKELQLAHTCSKAIQYAFVVANAPSTYVHEIVVNIVNNTMCMCKDNIVH